MDEGINEDPQSALADYGEGVSAKRIRLENTRMLERAIRGKWPIRDEDLPAVVQRQVKTATDPDSSNREATAAARCLVSMESQNQEIIFRTLDKIVPDQVAVEHQHHTTDTKGEVAELLSNADYLEYLREKAVREDSDPGTICAVHDGRNVGAVANGSAPTSPRPGTNGNRNWRK